MQSLRLKSVAFVLNPENLWSSIWRCQARLLCSSNAVTIFASAEGIKLLLKNSGAIDWIGEAFGHLKVIGYTAAARPSFARAGIADDLDEGVIELDARGSIAQYIEAAKRQRVWDRQQVDSREDDT